MTPRSAVVVARGLRVALGVMLAVIGWPLALVGISIVVVSCNLMGCTKATPCCLKRDNAETRRCMVQCASAANPKSDEEGEDLVAQCHSSCEHLTCEDWVVVEQVPSEREGTACIQAGGYP